MQLREVAPGAKAMARTGPSTQRPQSSSLGLARPITEGESSAPALDDPVHQSPPFPSACATPARIPFSGSITGPSHCLPFPVVPVILVPESSNAPVFQKQDKYKKGKEGWLTLTLLGINSRSGGDTQDTHTHLEAY